MFVFTADEMEKEEENQREKGLGSRSWLGVKKWKLNYGTLHVWFKLGVTIFDTIW